MAWAAAAVPRLAFAKKGEETCCSLRYEHVGKWGAYVDGGGQLLQSGVDGCVHLRVPGPALGRDGGGEGRDLVDILACGSADGCGGGACRGLADEEIRLVHGHSGVVDEGALCRCTVSMV